MRWDESFRTEQLGGGHVAVAVGEGAAGDKAAYELAQERRIGFDLERDVAVVGPHERVAELQRRAVEGLAAVLGKPVEVQQLLEEHGDGARIPLGEGVNLPDARDEVGHRGDVGG